MNRLPTVAMLVAEVSAEVAGDSPRTDAEILIAWVTGKSRSWLYAHADAPVDEALIALVRQAALRRRTGEPVAHIIGASEFWSLPLQVSANTLIPRPETELLVELALLRLPHGKTAQVLDLGTGSGAIALAIAHERLHARLTAVDAEPDALVVAAANAQRLGLSSIRWLASDWYAALQGQVFDLIVSNPPYISDADPHLAQGDLRFEPRSALAAGPDGLDALRPIIGGAGAHLRGGGSLLVEHGWEQGDAVRSLFTEAAFLDVKTFNDIEGRERVTLGNR